ncbi:acetyl-CoA carboxylase biotin carboxyl carrier protein subunit [Mesorhizobium sp. L-8-10]|uniref:acetyl-CoA carboxylase n=1 Tax=unclassified Mesorhizobium TaxID=325217 RepID=UPI001926A4D4|nr:MULTISPECIES: acetyl-CoA carboxylase [unclassified Mesorhizobium]BCH27534.1 acetyl-CoA carboxylase biotin carboxyl carrier protein subunit [Mesorhizobium sp. L-8-3]BCH35492.1 acetyl-CoA carboxylase biotin carboxyl carrier protein subunit [Mesorhizobium sp. L-8-10]
MSPVQIKSPLPGVFYRRPSPDSAPFKNDGDAVAAADVIGLVEVMKSFHEVKAGVSGNGVQFLVDDGDAVMAGQVLAELGS